MSIRCSVCLHPNAKEIDEGMLTGELSIPKVAELYGLSKSAVGRHKKKCLLKEAPSTISDALPMEELKAGPPRVKPYQGETREPGTFLTGDEVLEKLHALMDDCQGIIDTRRDSNKGGDAALILMAVDKISKVIQVYIKFMGLAKETSEEQELKHWREIGTIIWGFLDEKGLREEFESALSSRGL